MKIIVFSFILLFFACQEAQIPTPRPHQYPRLILPEQVYDVFDPEACPFILELPQQSIFSNTDSRWADDVKHQCWFDIAWSDLNATLHCSYFPINKTYALDSLINDAFELASKHNVKATYRDEVTIKNSAGHDGLIFEITGPVASPYQFYITDKESHFVRGSLYFDTKVEPDSIKPVLAYLKQDVEHIIASMVFDK